MTNKDYETIACCIGHSFKYAMSHRNQPYCAAAARQVADLRDRLMLEFEFDNPRFSKDKFIRYINKIMLENEV